MSDSFKARAEANLRGRHMAKLRELMEDIQENAGYAVADLNRGCVPRLRNLLADAQEIAARISALEAIEELAAIYKAGD